jgi:hypothetical protein
VFCRNYNFYARKCKGLHTTPWSAERIRRSCLLAAQNDLRSVRRNALTRSSSFTCPLDILSIFDLMRLPVSLGHLSQLLNGVVPWWWISMH